jgi:hypothetical protein
MTSRKSGLPAQPHVAGNRSFWLKHLHRWHWISSALCLIGMLLFAATGITLNHAGEIEASPRITVRTATLPAELLTEMPIPAEKSNQPLPAAISNWIGQELGVSAGEREAEWSNDEVYLPLSRPGGDAWLSIDRESGAVRHEETTRGWISYFNDLHKGRHTGLAWSWFLDLFAIACLVFCITGLFLLHLHASARPTTWPVVGLGLVVPVILAILFIH